MTKEQLHKYVSESTGNESNICQIYAIKEGLDVYDDCWHGFKTLNAMNVNSVTKGIMALLVGIALDKGFIKSLDEKVIGFFPDYQVKKGEKTIYDVTLKHLLTMTAPYKGKSEPWKKVCTSDDWTKAALDFLGGRKGITGEFRYATLGIQILAGIIERAAGKKCIDFANRNLFLPLGIPEHTLHGDSSKEDQFNFFMNNEQGSPEKRVVFGSAGYGYRGLGALPDRKGSGKARRPGSARRTIWRKTDCLRYLDPADDHAVSQARTDVRQYGIRIFMV